MQLMFALLNLTWSSLLSEAWRLSLEMIVPCRVVVVPTGMHLQQVISMRCAPCTIAALPCYSLCDMRAGR
jgi:hypothetical protein